MAGIPQVEKRKVFQAEGVLVFSIGQRGTEMVVESKGSRVVWQKIVPLNSEEA